MKFESEERAARQKICELDLERYRLRLASRKQQEAQDSIECDKMRVIRQNTRVEQEALDTRGQYEESAARDHSQCVTQCLELQGQQSVLQMGRHHKEKCGDQEATGRIPMRQPADHGGPKVLSLPRIACLSESELSISN
jgi:hypothetical protein